MPGARGQNFYSGLSKNVQTPSTTWAPPLPIAQINASKMQPHTTIRAACMHTISHLHIVLNHLHWVKSLEVH